MRSFARSLHLTLLLGLGLTACSTPDPTEQVMPPRMEIAGLTLGKSTAFEERAWLDLRVTNPNGFAVGVERLDFDLVIGERYFASGVVAQDIAVPGGGEVLVPVVMTIGAPDPSATVQELNSNKPLTYRLIGEADLQQIPEQTLIFDYFGRIEPSKTAEKPAGLRSEPEATPGRPLADAG